MRIRVLLADDHTMVRRGLVSLLEASGACQVVAEAADGEEAVAAALAQRPQVAILDVSMPKLNGLEAARRIRARQPGTRVLILTAHGEDEYVLPLVRAGVAGYLLKDSAVDELIDAVRAIASGRTWFGQRASEVIAASVASGRAAPDDPFDALTEREREVFHLTVQGKTQKEIGAALGISAKTVENHRAHLMQKLGTSGTAELVRYAARRGWL
jgi:RNA polymerase sigma factor (sigma-70 family)